jgi:hypothetical protein
MPLEPVIMMMIIVMWMSMSYVVSISFMGDGMSMGVSMSTIL